jgi:predicted MPP superfamily phosphohydrolase
VEESEEQQQMTPWTFVHLADPQPGSPRSFRFEPAWMENWKTARRQIREIGPDLLLVGGDLTRDGSIHDFEFEAMKADLDALGLPVHVIPGNMDTGNKHTPVQGCLPARDDVSLNVTSKQLKNFERFFGPIQWSFVHKNVRFSGFYGALAGSGLPEEEDMWRWLEDLEGLPRAAHHVLIMHYALFMDRFDEPDFDITKKEDYFGWYFSIGHPHRERMLKLFKAAGVGLVISGHIHCYRTAEGVVDGIRFVKAPTTARVQMGERKPIRRTGHSAAVRCLLPLSGDRRLLSGSDDTTVLIWNLPPTRQNRAKD